jgi:hypothetical protein
MAHQETGLSKLLAQESEQAKRERIRAEERKAHAARTTELLKQRYGVED